MERGVAVRHVSPPRHHGMRVPSQSGSSQLAHPLPRGAHFVQASSVSRPVSRSVTLTEEQPYSPPHPQRQALASTSPLDLSGTQGYQRCSPRSKQLVAQHPVSGGHDTMPVRQTSRSGAMQGIRPASLTQSMSNPLPVRHPSASPNMRSPSASPGLPTAAPDLLPRYSPSPKQPQLSDGASPSQMSPPRYPMAGESRTLRSSPADPPPSSAAAKGVPGTELSDPDMMMQQLERERAMWREEELRAIAAAERGANSEMKSKFVQELQKERKQRAAAQQAAARAIDAAAEACRRASELHQEVVELRSQPKQDPALVAEVEDLRQQVQQLQDQLRERDASLDDTRRQLNDAQEQLRARDAELNDAKEVVQELRNENERLRNACASKDSEAEQLRQQAEQLRQQVEQMRKEGEQMRQQIAKHPEELKKLRASLDTTGEIERLRGEVRDLEEAMGQQGKQIQQKDAELQRLRKEMMDKQKECKDCEQGRAQDRRRIDELERENAELREELEKVKQELAELKGPRRLKSMHASNIYADAGLEEAVDDPPEYQDQQHLSVRGRQPSAISMSARGGTTAQSGDRQPMKSAIRRPSASPSSTPAADRSAHIDNMWSAPAPVADDPFGRNDTFGGEGAGGTFGDTDFDIPTGDNYMSSDPFGGGGDPFSAGAEDDGGDQDWDIPDP